METEAREATKPADWKAPIKSVAEKPVKIEKAKVSIINDADTVKNDLYYPFYDMSQGQGFFIPNELNQTTLQTFNKVRSHVKQANELWSEIEHDEFGDEVWETVVIKSRKRNADGTLQLDSSGNAIITADSVTRPKLLRSRRYNIYQIAKDTDLIAGKPAENDGVLIVRVI